MLKDKKVIIYNKTEVQDDIGNWVTAYQPIHPGSLWAYARQLSQKEYFAAGTAGYKEDLKLLAKEATQAEIPPADEIVPYGG